MSSDRDKLIKLVRLLSSSHDGEVLGAVRAIERVLSTSGKSFHDLADTIASKVIEIKIKTVEVRIETKEVKVEVKTREPSDDWLDMCDILISNALNDREREFIASMQDRFKFKPGFEPTDRQANWFVDICRKYKADEKWKQTQSNSEG